MIPAMQLDPYELDRRAYSNLFDLMQQYQAEHPEASDDEAYEAVAFGPRRPPVVDYEKEART
jgi:hypothetical protein